MCKNLCESSTKIALELDMVSTVIMSSDGRVMLCRRLWTPHASEPVQLSRLRLTPPQTSALFRKLWMRIRKDVSLILREIHFLESNETTGLTKLPGTGQWVRQREVFNRCERRIPCFYTRSRWEAEGAMLAGLLATFVNRFWYCYHHCLANAVWLVFWSWFTIIK